MSTYHKLFKRLTFFLVCIALTAQLFAREPETLAPITALDMTSLRSFIEKSVADNPRLFSASPAPTPDEANIAQSVVIACDQLLAQRTDAATMYWANTQKAKAMIGLLASNPETHIVRFEAYLRSLAQSPQYAELARLLKYYFLRAKSGIIKREFAEAKPTEQPFVVDDFLKNGEEIRAFLSANPGRASDELAEIVHQDALYLTSRNSVHSERIANLLSVIVDIYGEQKAPSKGAKIAASVRRLLLPKNVFELSSVQLDGKAFNLTDLQKAQYKDKVIVVEFFATWCGPCLKELPNLRNYYSKYKDKGLEIVSVSTDEKLGDLKSFAEKEKLPWTIVSQQMAADKGIPKVSSFYGISSIPYIILIGRDGKVIATQIDPKNLEALISKALASHNNGAFVPATHSLKYQSTYFR